MGFTRFVEIGRVVYINYGPDAGKSAVILDVIDQNRAFVEGVGNGVKRQQIPLRRLTLTETKIRIGRGARVASLKKAYTKANASASLEKSNFAKKLAKQTTRHNLSDFERFQVMVQRRRRAHLLRQEFNKLRKVDNKAKHGKKRTPYQRAAGEAPKKRSTGAAKKPAAAAKGKGK